MAEVMQKHHVVEEEELEVPLLKHSRPKHVEHDVIDVEDITRTTSSSSSDSSKTSGDTNSTKTDTEGKLEEEIVHELEVPVSEQVSENGGKKATEAVGTKREDLVLGDTDEEVIELEFERAVEKAHTHTAYCPNCSSQITRVVLRRKITRVQPVVQPSPGVDNRELFGCLSCFSFFTPSGNDGLKRFWFFKEKESKRPDQAPVHWQDDESGVDAHNLPGSKMDDSNKKPVKQGHGFNPWGIFGRGGQKITEENEQGNAGENNNLPVSDLGTHSRPNDGPANTTGGFPEPGIKPGTSQPPPVGSDLVIDIKDGAGSCPQGPVDESSGSIVTEQHVHDGTYTGRQDVAARGFESVEILKCIVYGGLLESIASLGVVSSAVSSGATKLNIIALGLANVASGLFVIFHNLMELRKDSEQHGRRYHESLGRKENFLLHTTLAIISFLVFGLVPPVMYAFTELWQAAAASFACILVLAIAKAYVQRCQYFSEYIKTILSYVMLGITATGIAYVVGDQIKILIEKLGWLEPIPAGPSFVPALNFATQAWSS